MSDQVGTRNVDIGKVGRVGLVEVVVGFEERGTRGGNAVMKEGALRKSLWAARKVENEGMEDPNLAAQMSAWCHQVISRDTYRPPKGQALPVETQKQQK